jgi:hypothetical protein
MSQEELQIALTELRKQVREEILGDDALMTEDEAAKALRISRRKLQDMKRAGEITCGYIGGKPLYSIGMIRRYSRHIFDRDAKL